MESNRSVLGRVMDDPRVRMLLERPSMRKDPFTVYVKLCEIGIPKGGVIGDPIDRNFDSLIGMISDVCGIEEEDLLSALCVLEGVGLIQGTEDGEIKIPSARRSVQDPNRPAPMSDAERARRYRQRKKERLQHDATLQSVAVVA